MREATLLRFSPLLTLLHLLPLVSAQQTTPSPTQPSRVQQPILSPSKKDVLTPGGTFTIRWEPNSHFANVTLEIWDKTTWGYSRDFGELCYHWVNPFCGTIASHAPNTGSYEWHIPKPGSEFPRGEKVFWLKMYVDDYLKPDIGNNDPVLSYSQNFAFAPEPGKNGSVSSSVTSEASPTPTGAPDFQTPQGTITVTVHDGISTMRAMGATSIVPNASMTATGLRNTGTPSPREGGANAIKASWMDMVQMVPLLFLGLV